MKKLTLNEVVNRVNDVPALSSTVMTILSLLKAPEPDRITVQAEIMKDQGLTTKILKIANSAFYRGRRTVDTVTDATVLLGFSSVQTLVLSSAVESTINRTLKGYSYTKDQLWKQAQISAFLAKSLAKKTGFYNPDLAYTAGLLKDIGMVVLDDYVLGHSIELKDRLKDNKASYITSEEAVIGFNHGQVGGRLIERWHLSDQLIEVVKYHHQPFEAVNNLQLVALVHIADHLVWQMALHKGIDSLAHRFNNETLTLLKLHPSDLENILAETTKLLENEGLLV